WAAAEATRTLSAEASEATWAAAEATRTLSAEAAEATRTPSAEASHARDRASKLLPVLLSGSAPGQPRLRVVVRELPRRNDANDPRNRINRGRDAPSRKA
ncbi:hypothetical protein, partial [Mesorhizobium sp.]|uniref:hypothetical protein n=1 Tax=Mesorhizobium sp. TaxID=1871066 RepID=UPI0025797EF5